MAAAEGELNVAVIGGAGYVGGELLRMLAQHPAVARVRAFSESQAGKAWAGAHPALAHLPAGVFEAPAPDEAARWADVVFLALPHGASQRLIEALADARMIIDLAADFRVADPELYAAHYGEHACPEIVKRFTYALADIAPEALAGRTRLAVPGCFATAAALAVWPLAKEGLLAEAPACFAITGSSGAGAEPKRTTHHPVRAHSFFGYSLGGHRHEAELAERLRAWTGGAIRTCELYTHAAPLVRGIHATVRARLTHPQPELLGVLRGAYSGRPFVRVLDSPPELAAVVGTNFVHLHATVREKGEIAIVTATIDNLVKGAAGQAVQAMNLSLGLPETAGLEFSGVYPC